MRRLVLLIFSCSILALQSLAQPSAGFTAPATACLTESIQLANTSSQATHYTWDFCHRDLVTDPIITQSATLPATGSFFYASIRMVFNNGVWIGFMTDATGQKLLRLDYGKDVNSNPTITDLGNLGGMLTSPGALDIVKEGSTWLIFICNVFQNNVLRVTFGNGLQSLPTLTTANIVIGSTPIGIRAVTVGNARYLIVSYNSNAVVVYDFDISFGGLPIGSTVTTNSLIDWGVDVISDGTNWYGLVGSNGNGKVLRLNFGTNLMNVPTITDLGNVPGASEVRIVKEGANFVGFVRSNNNGVYRVFFGDDISQTPTIQRIATMLLQEESRSLEIIRLSPSWKVLTVESFTGKLLSLDFAGGCGIEMSMNSSVETIPINLKYTTPGDYFLELSAFDDAGLVDVTSQTLTVSSNTSPAIDIIAGTVKCIDVANSFQVSSSKPLTAQHWNFGDGFSESINPATHAFASAGTFTVAVEVTDMDGCKNSASVIQKTYTPPSASFSLPVGLICTNNEFTFTNSTTDNFEGNLSYQWLVDNNPESTLRDFKYAFTSQGDKEIKLIASIPGCSDEDVQSVLNVQAGPTVGFTISGKCEGETVNFTNTSSGAIAGYVWNSGNGQTGTNVNFSQSYAAKGVYNVSLETTGANGCVSTTTKPLTIYSLPQPNFSLDLPPFSCSGTPSQFNDLTPSPTDSNLSSWAWSFGDAGTSTDRNPLHTFTNAGDYNVSLTATTNFGCSASFQKPVTITASPAADFTYTPACINQGTRFTDASGSGVKSWFWTIGGSTYAFSNPTHVFSGSGGFSAKLTVTGNNNCVASVTKTINVPVAPSLSFSVDNACEKQAANFKDTSPANTDPAASWSWDFAGQGTATGNAAQYSFASAGSYSVKMTSTQQSGCMYSLSKNVTINTTPVAAFTSSPEWGVPPLAVQFTNTSTGANSYSWHFNDKNNSTSTLASPGFLFTDLGDYVVDLVATSALGCSGSTSGKISVIIPSLDLELKQLQLVKDPTSNVYRIFVTVKNKSNYLLTSVDVVVDISGNALIKETINTNLLPDAEIVQLLNNQILPHGNLLTYLCASIEVDNDNDPFNNSKCEPVEEEVVIFNPYPNPSNGTFRFEWIAPTTDNAHFEIFNAMGQLAFEQYAESVQVGLNQVQFDLSNLNTGAYYFRFNSNSVSKTLPIQIVR